ncbi:MAG: hypothetical protein Ct9H300mP7_5350 [Verrucomicrobiota bacterium]|nr:MAG: hypothetical protein Ct9H300mP7_5350 [Verrucomicrobiota bacterium]
MGYRPAEGARLPQPDARPANGPALMEIAPAVTNVTETRPNSLNRTR